MESKLLGLFFVDAMNASRSCTVEFSPISEFYDYHTYVYDAFSDGSMLNSSVSTVHNELSFH